jgi:mono/diheme cytochrome c family protein
MRVAYVSVLVGVAFGCGLLTASAAETPLQRGKYLATIMDCGGCHTTGSFIGQPDPAKYLAGSDQGWAIPTGVFWPSNLTSDKETGIGTWSAKDIVKLIRTGVTPEGREVAPIMPWRAYSALSDADLEALAEFIKTVPAVKHAVPGPAKAKEVKTPVLTLTVLPPS